MNTENDHAEALARILDPNRHFYNCTCGWSGDDLLYAGSTYHSLLPIEHGQGVCPDCSRHFLGCFEESVYDARMRGE